MWPSYLLSAVGRAYSLSAGGNLRCYKRMRSTSLRGSGCKMKSSAKYIAIVFCFLAPGMVKAQNVARVECPRSEGYVYLYSSMTTLDVRGTLPCGEQVHITGRYDGYYSVQTEKGDAGFMPQSSLVLLKDTPGPKAPKPEAARPTRPRMAYDEPVPHAETPAGGVLSSAGFITLLSGTPIRLRLGKTISSATAHVGDVVDLEVEEDVLADGLCVIPEGATVVGLVTEAEPKKRMGHNGKLALSINFVRLRDNEKATVRSFQDGTGSSTTAGNLPSVHGKEIVFTEGTEITAYVDGDMHLKREAFEAAKAGAAPTRPAPNPAQPPRSE